MSELRISFPSPCGQSWDEMQPSGCNRFCATCSETIHDLSQLTVQAAETLLRDPGKHCVRAQIGPDGALAVKPSRSGRQRKILVAVGASLGLFTSACESIPQASSPTGLIFGKVDAWSMEDAVTATAEDGRTYRTKVRKDGSYRFERLPYGSYILKLVDNCGQSRTGRIILQESEHSVSEVTAPQGCIVVGMAKIRDDRA